MKPHRHKLIKDRHAKGGGSHFLDIACAACGRHLLLYQKDGSGGLLRLFLDRIHAPADLADLAGSCADRSAVPPLVCPECRAVVGLPMTHRGGRLAFRLVRGSFRRRKSRGDYPPPNPG